MKLRQLTVLLVLMLVLPVFLIHSLPTVSASTVSPDVYVGVDVAYEDLVATEQLVDKISSYSNLLIIGCTGISYNVTRLNELAQYVYDRNMSFIVYTDERGEPSQQWLDTARNQWGNSFLGLYVYDEPGGKQLDQAKFPTVTSANNYTDAATQYIEHTNWWLKNAYAYSPQPEFFTSDYALYWFDYKTGYNTIFAEFGWNYSRQLNVALCRGAATVQNKDWGVMIAWTYTNPPYIESGPELYNDMVLAYDNGAKYIVVFDTNENYTQDILGQEHFDAMSQFWQYVQDNPRSTSALSERTAYVLPDDYAYGFRGPQDKIWGLWEADTLSTDISMSVYSLLDVCGTKLDIIYPDDQQAISSFGYGNVIYWNDQRLLPADQWPNVPNTLAPSPTSLPTLTPSPTPLPSPSPSPSSSPSSSPPPSATEGPTSSPDPSTSLPLPMNYIYAAAVGIVAAAVLVGLFVFRRRR